MIKPLIAVVAISMLATAVPAQHPASPYATLKDRPIKALSADEVESLRAGRGMGMALPAELNRYPGPMHVLDHATALDLSLDQRQRVGDQFRIMRSEAVTLGERIVELERALDTYFQSGVADATTVDRITSQIGVLYGQLRAAHLRAHVATRAILTDMQVAAYQTIRGYDGARPKPAHKH